MRLLTISTVTVLLAALTHARPQQHQQQIDPAYLQQYYQQVSQSSGAVRSAGAPIYEQENAANQQPQYISQSIGQQIRVKDAVAEQVRAQQQQQPQYIAPSVRQYLQQPQPQQVQYASPQQQHQYRPAPPQQSPKYTQAVLPRRPAAQPQYQSVTQEDSRLNKEEEETYDQNPSYQFGFDVKDDEFTNYQNRKEQRDGNVIKGSYSVVDSDGFIRTVTYTADPKEGFKAEVVREPTDIVVKIPKPQPQHQQSAAQPHRLSAAAAAPAPQPQYYQQPQSQYRVQAPQKQHHHQQQAQQYQYE